MAQACSFRKQLNRAGYTKPARQRAAGNACRGGALRDRRLDMGVAPTRCQLAGHPAVQAAGAAFHGALGLCDIPGAPVQRTSACLQLVGFCAFMVEALDVRTARAACLAPITCWGPIIRSAVPMWFPRPATAAQSRQLCQTALLHHYPEQLSGAVSDSNSRKDVRHLAGACLRP